MIRHSARTGGEGAALAASVPSPPSAAREAGDVRGSLRLASYFGVGPLGDGAQDAARDGQVLGREVAEEPKDDLVERGANTAIPRLSRLGEPDAGPLAGQGLHELRGSQLGDRREHRRIVDLPGAGDPGEKLVAVDGCAAGRADGEHQPLVERGAGAGQEGIQDCPEGALGLADDLGVEGWVSGHRLPPWARSSYPMQRDYWHVQRWLDQHYSVGMPNKPVGSRA